jgi:hypothetical protein
LDFDNASDRMMDVVYELQGYGLVDGHNELTKTGQQAIELSHSLGGSKDRRRAANMKNAEDINLDDEEFELPDTDVYDDDYGGNFELGDDDSVMQMNRAGTLNPQV